MTDEEFELKTRLYYDADYYNEAARQYAIRTSNADAGLFNLHQSIITKKPELSQWKCHLFGITSPSYTWVPVAGQVPNWFWRKMQYLCFGNRWVKEK